MKFREPLNRDNMDVLRSYAPSVFAVHPSSKVSDKYRFIPTSEIVEALMDNGFACSSVVENRVRKDDKRGYQTHLLKFRPNSVDALKVGDVFPEIRVKNSHDGLSALNIDAGLFRLACLNGMTVADSLIQKISVRHSGKMVTDAIEASFRVLSDMPKAIEQVKHWQSIELDPKEKLLLADAALSLKYEADEEGKMIAPIAPVSLLHARRQGDQKADLWTTFNVIQENLIKGGQRGIVTDQYGYRKRASTRAVTSIDGDTKLNKALWSLAEKMASLKIA